MNLKEVGSRSLEVDNKALCQAHIMITEREDELIWDYDPMGICTPKGGYLHLIVELRDREIKWWWWKVWKLTYPPKAKLLTWSILPNKVPTWNILQKCDFQGLRWCALCKNA